MKKNELPERFAWAVKTMDIQPSDHLLEIGGGVGLLAEQVAGLLKDGKLVMVDKSEAMISKAVERNKIHIENRITTFIKKDLEVTILPERFDKIVAFNVSAFWKNPRFSLPVIRRHLKPAGQFYLFYQPPVEVTRQIAKEAAEVLKKNGLKVEKTLFKSLQPASAFCIIGSLVTK